MRIKLGTPLLLKEIARAIGGKLLSFCNPTIEYVSTDSREVLPGDFYIPIKGEKFDGEDFVEEVLQKGCYAISSKNQNAHIFVKDSAKALLDFASYYNKTLPYILYRIGITGSTGKTTTKEFLKVLLSATYKVHANEGNYNNEIGLPMSILSAPQNSEILLMELGMNHKGEIHRLSNCLRPDMAVITNVGSSHIGNLGSKENIARAKLEIADGMNEGRIYVLENEELLTCAKNRVTLSLTDSNADFYLRSFGSNIAVYNRGKKYAEALFNFNEEHLKKCLLFACAIAIDLGVDSLLLENGISQISSVNTRQKVFYLDKYMFIDDSYNASLESIIASYDFIKSMDKSTAKSLLLGDVLELGEMSEDIHYQIGKSIQRGLFNRIFLFGNFAQHTKRGALDSGFPAEGIHVNTLLGRPDLTALQIKECCTEGEVILMKASREIKLERILEHFK